VSKSSSGDEGQDNRSKNHLSIRLITSQSDMVADFTSMGVKQGLSACNSLFFGLRETE
jgi:hypothetical protein